MSDLNNEKETDHEYDGIRELDNPLPFWWLTIFWVTVIFGIGYYAYYEFAGGPSSEETLNQAMTQITAVKSAETEATPVLKPAELEQLISNPEALKAGASEYTAKCASCHGVKLEGMIGPNLIDPYWLHGTGSVSDIADTITKGVAAKGMPPWSGVISTTNIANISAYIVSLKGSQPANAKAPQGKLIK